LSRFLSTSRVSPLANLLPVLLFTALLAGCQTTQERETTETQQPQSEPAPEAPPPDEEREQASEESALTPKTLEDTVDATAESDASAEQPPTAQDETAEADEVETAPEEERELPVAEPEQADPGGSSGEREAAMAQAEDRNAPTAGGAEAPQTEAGGSKAPAPERRPNAAEVARDAEVPQNSDARFREAMRRFDGRLARERFGTGGRQDDSRGGDFAGGAGGGNASGGGAGEAGTESGPGAVAGNRNPFEDGQDDGERDPNATGRGGIGQRNRHSPPPGTPDGRDDDIVARQLREAAETETDPELRERLWEEYRAYKDDQT